MRLLAGTMGWLFSEPEEAGGGSGGVGDDEVGPD
jgi:hypothetical protein